MSALCSSLIKHGSVPTQTRGEKQYLSSISSSHREPWSRWCMWYPYHLSILWGSSPHDKRKCWLCLPPPPRKAACVGKHCMKQIHIYVICQTFLCFLAKLLKTDYWWADITVKQLNTNCWSRYRWSLKVGTLPSYHTYKLLKYYMLFVQMWHMFVQMVTSLNDRC